MEFHRRVDFILLKATKNKILRMERIIDSQQLRVFVSLARHGNMSEAARALRLTPSALSHALKALEKDLGCRLMLRDSRRMILSAQGRRFLEDAQEILNKMQKARERMASSAETRGGCQRISLHPALSPAVLPSVLREYTNSFPDHTVKIDTLSTADAKARLLSDDLDLALVVEPVPQAGLSFLPLGEDSLQFVVHPLHPWAVKRKVFREDIPRRALIMTDAASETYYLIMNYFKADGYSIVPLMEVTDEESIKRLVQMNLGAGILSPWMIETEVRQGSLVSLPLGRRHLARTWGIWQRREQAAGLAHTILIDLLRDALRSLFESPQC